MQHWLENAISHLTFLSTAIQIYSKNFPRMFTFGFIILFHFFFSVFLLPFSFFIFFSFRCFTSHPFASIFLSSFLVIVVFFFIFNRRKILLCLQAIVLSRRMAQCSTHTIHACISIYLSILPSTHECMYPHMNTKFTLK